MLRRGRCACWYTSATRLVGALRRSAIPTMLKRPLLKDPSPSLDLGTLRQLLRGGEAAVGLRVMGDKWSLLILRDVFLGVRRFGDLRRLSGAARGTLTSRLNALVAIGILYRNPYHQSPTRYEYRLTDKGLALYPVVMMLWSWQSKWGGRGSPLPRLIHKACGKVTVPELACAHCLMQIDPREVGFSPGPGLGGRTAQPAGYRRRECLSGKGDADAAFADAIDIVGDQWAPRVLAAIMYRARRYDDMQRALGVATNILADRLQRLVRSGVVQRTCYQRRPLRYEYKLTPKGLDLYGFTAALHSWTEKWAAGPGGPVLILRHLPCGKRLKTELVCPCCHRRLGPRDVSMDAGPRWSRARRDAAGPRG
jgi:DNA-binding HxlR family transcriptional regulator